MANQGPTAPTSLFEGTFRAKKPDPHADPFLPFLSRHPASSDKAETPSQGGTLRTGDSLATPSTNNQASSSSSSRLFRSQSITEQLNKTPRVTPNWGHSLSKSYGGSDWPLPASESSTNTAVSTPGSVGYSTIKKDMYTASDTSDQLWSEQNGPKKRGPKPKNEPATTVISFQMGFSNKTEATTT